MKSKKLLFSTILSVSCIATYLIFTSSATAVQGVVGASQIGCATCHGNNANAATTITVTGIPAGGYVSGTTYNLTLKVTNATKLGAGFDLSVTGGTLSAPPVNTVLVGTTELHHTSPLNMVAGTSTWNFSWTAPATNTITFHVAGNAVNNNNDDSGDQWNKVSLPFNKAVPTDITDFEKVNVVIYPNPVTNYITVRSTDEININSFTSTSINGNTIQLAASKINNSEYQLETKSLANGNYILSYSVNGKVYHSNFIKK